jgi:hypothetical protein
MSDERAERHAEALRQIENKIDTEAALNGGRLPPPLLGMGTEIKRIIDAALAQEDWVVASPLTACEHAFVTSQGSAYARFHRSLDTGSVTNALAAAAAPGGLTDSLELMLLLRDESPERCTPT